MASRGQTAASEQLSMSTMIDAWLEDEARKSDGQPEPIDNYTAITASKLRERGWSDVAIQKFAGEPHYVVPNPHNVTGTPSNLWKLSEILVIEASNEFQSWRATQAPRHGAGLLDILRERLIDGYTVSELSESDLVLAAFSNDHISSCMVCDCSRIHDNRDGYLAFYALHHLVTEASNVSEAFRDISRQSAMDIPKAKRMIASAKYTALVQVYPTLMPHFIRELNVDFLLW